MSTIRVGIVGLGANTRLRHVPGLRACRDVEITGVCNRRAESTQAAAEEFSIPKRFETWQQLVADPDIDAVVIGTWPYLHSEITCAALAAGKHVLTEARMARNLAEARQMLAASQQHPDLTTQIVPSPFGFQVDWFVRQLLDGGYLGELREVVVLGVNSMVADPNSPLHWRQSAEYSGLNMLAMGILHETVMRWTPDPIRVQAQTHVFTPKRTDPETGELAAVGTPDSVHVLTELPGGARGIYHLSGALHHGPGFQIHLYGSEGTMKFRYDGVEQVEELLTGKRDDAKLTIAPTPRPKGGGWRVEQEFINAIRGEEEVKLTDFATGVRYMEFTEAVARSAASGEAVSLPLD